MIENAKWCAYPTTRSYSGPAALLDNQGLAVTHGVAGAVFFICPLLSLGDSGVALSVFSHEDRAECAMHPGDSPGLGPDVRCLVIVLIRQTGKKCFYVALQTMTDGRAWKVIGWQAFSEGGSVMYQKIFLESNAFICKFTIKPDRREEFLKTLNDLWKSFVDVMERDTNFMFYGWGRNPNELFIIESWKDERATNAVRGEPRFKEAVAVLIECSAAPMTLQLLSGLEGDRSIFDMYPAGPSEHHPSGDSLVTQFT